MVSESTRDVLIEMLNEKDREIKHLKILVEDLRHQVMCDHPTTTYQETEVENNVRESLSCDECGCELDLPNGDENY